MDTFSVIVHILSTNFSKINLEFVASAVKVSVNFLVYFCIYDSHPQFPRWQMSGVTATGAEEPKRNFYANRSERPSVVFLPLVIGTTEVLRTGRKQSIHVHRCTLLTFFKIYRKLTENCIGKYYFNPNEVTRSCSVPSNLHSNSGTEPPSKHLPHNITAQTRNNSRNSERSTQHFLHENSIINYHDSLAKWFPATDSKQFWPINKIFQKTCRSSLVTAARWYKPIANSHFSDIASNFLPLLRPITVHLQPAATCVLWSTSF